MHARVAAFENRDVSLADRLVDLVRSHSADVAGAQRQLLLLESRARSALGITFFESEDEMGAAEPDFTRMGGEIPELVRGRRTSVARFEVAVDETGDEAAAARVTSLTSMSYRIVEMLESVREQLVGEAAELDGWRGVLTLADRDTGATRIVTFWASDDALRRSEIRETQLCGRIAAAAAGSITSVRRYDVALSAVLAPA